MVYIWKTNIKIIELKKKKKMLNWTKGPIGSTGFVYWNIGNKGLGRKCVVLRLMVY